MKKYSALIIDLINSRSYVDSDRVDIQKYLIKVIASLNKVFEDGLELDVVFSGGDEVQGLFSSPQAAYLYVRLFDMLVSPVGIRAGIGVGEWNVQIDDAMSTEQDGTAYHNARYAIEHVEDALGYRMLVYSEGPDDIFINSALNMSVALTSNQSEYQNELMLLSELMYPIDINRVFKLERYAELKYLIEQRNTIGYFMRRKSSAGIRKYPLNAVQDNIILDCHPVDALAAEESFFVSSGKVKGLPVKLANLLGTSRQSIEKSIKGSNIYQARNSTIAVLKAMNRYIQEGE